MSAKQGRLLLTGASGFLGRATAAVLEGSGWTLIRAVRDPRDPSSVALDVSDVRSVARLGELRNIDAVVHIAAKVDFGASAVDEFFSENIASVAVISAMTKSWGAHLVFTSTALVDDVSASSFPVNQDPLPEYPYTKSKRLGEALIAASGVDATILRLGGIFGSNGPAHLGLNRAIAAAERGTPPTIVGAGRARRNYIYVADAAAQIAHALERRLLGTHVVAGTEALSIHEMLDALCEAFLPGRRPEAAAGSEAVDQVLATSPAFPPTRSFRAALADIIATARR